MIGQGKILARSMSMASVVASVQAGRAVLPVLLADHEVEQTSPTHTWMIATQTDLAVAVLVEPGASDSQTAGPTLKDSLR